MKDVKEEYLKTIIAYWCNASVGEFDDRYEWAWNLLEEVVEGIGFEARALLELGARSAPNDKLAAYFAAGPLENYIGVIVDVNDRDEAKRISTNKFIFPLMEYVWGEIEAFKQMSPATKGNNVEIAALPLSMITLQEASAYWCYKCTSGILVDDFDKQFEYVEKLLIDVKTRDAVLEDLRLTAPDGAAEEYLVDLQQGLKYAD